MLKVKMLPMGTVEDVEDLDRLDTDYDATEVPILETETK